MFWIYFPALTLNINSFIFLPFLFPIPLFFYEDSSNDKHLIYSGISGLIVLLLFIPAISVSVRRLHDIDKSGWFVFISVIPFIGWVILAIILIGKGTEGKNRFGKYPLNLKIK